MAEAWTGILVFMKHMAVKVLVSVFFTGWIQLSAQTNAGVSEEPKRESACAFYSHLDKGTKDNTIKTADRLICSSEKTHLKIVAWNKTHPGRPSRADILPEILEGNIRFREALSAIQLKYNIQLKYK